VIYQGYLEQSGRSLMEISGKPNSDENNKSSDEDAPESCFMDCLIKLC
jgi:hypothetical protein